MKELIEKYTKRLEAMDENRAKEGHLWTDDYADGVDTRIKDTAEFIRDLKKLQENDKVLS